MYAFILTNLLLVILVTSSDDQILSWLASPWALALGSLIALCSLVAGYFKNASTINWHDGFATGSLIVWYAYWRTEFMPDALLFVFYPLYYCLFTSILTLALINKTAYFDLESVTTLRYLEKISRFNMPYVIGFVVVGILITRHYALYPMSMTFFIVRHTMLICLERIDKPYL